MPKKPIVKKAVKPNVIEVGRRNHISASQLDQFETCEVRWHYIYILGIKLAPGFALIQGGSFHFAEETNFKQKIKKKRDLKLSVVRDAFDQDFRERLRLRRVIIANRKLSIPVWEQNLKPNDVEREGLRALSVFHETVAPAVVPEGAEVSGDIEINGLEKPYTLKYAMDLVGKPIVQKNGRFQTAKSGRAVLDWKLIGKRMDAYEIERSFQYPAYAGAFRSLHGKMPDQFALLATIKTKKPQVQMMSVKPREDKIRWFMDRIARAIPAMEEIRQGKRLPRPAMLHPSFLSPCKPSSCGLWGICKVRPQ